MKLSDFCRTLHISNHLTDKPDPPESCTVTDVYYDNCVVHWTPPVDDGGTEITRYVVEALDNTTMSPWTPVAETTSGGERKIKCEGLAHRHLYRDVEFICTDAKCSVKCLRFMILVARALLTGSECEQLTKLVKVTPLRCLATTF